MRLQAVVMGVFAIASGLACAHSRSVIRVGRGDQGPSVVTCNIADRWPEPTRPAIDAWVETDCVTKRGVTIEVYEPAASNVKASDDKRVLHPGGEWVKTPPFKKPDPGTTVRVRLTATCVNGDDAGGTGECVMP